MTRINFAEVSVYAVQRLTCARGCGRNTRRSKRFWQTLNPWNTTTKGVPKSREDIYRELERERAAWVPEPFVCSYCRTNPRAQVRPRRKG